MKNLTDFRQLTGVEAISLLESMPIRQRRSISRTLIYKKNSRPYKLNDQLVLLEYLCKDTAISGIDQFYAHIAGAHKVSEMVSRPDVVIWLDRILEVEQQIRATPIVYGLRKDRTHLVFSALNVSLNLDLLIGASRASQLQEWFFQEVEDLNLRKMTPYLFNSTSNIIKCAGIVVLFRPDCIDRTADLMRRLVSYSIEINNPVYWWIFSRFIAPPHLDVL